MKIKTYENIVLKALEENKRARSDDFILYGSVLKRLGIDLQMSLYEFLANAKRNKVPSFETITRCRRHLQELRTDLQDSKTAVMREERIQEFKEYNRSGIGNKI